MGHILVIRYGGFGDLILSMGAFRSIRAHHAHDHVALLTMARFADLMRPSNYFDEILIDDRPGFSQALEWLRLARLLRSRGFDRVYDLQRNHRTALLYRVIGAGRKIEWSGVIRGASHFVRDDPDDRRHITERLAEQLAVAGVTQMVPPDLSWLRGGPAKFGLPKEYALVVSGGAPHRPEKRAPVEVFASLCRYLQTRGIAPVLLGTADERAHIDEILAASPGAIDLCDRTGFGDLADLARGAVGAVGNDTGPMHLVAAVGCPSLVLFTAASDPRRVRPLGPRVRVLQSVAPDRLDAEAVTGAWEELVALPAGASNPSRPGISIPTARQR
ncbi:MAG: glycosyltransferase family 9 protein [Alphaproteobacteria bacterium]|nr:glycosyltransferase family 9 protein [Alphaproteobacteria bacterium]